MEGIALWCDAFLVLQGKGGQNERKTETSQHHFSRTGFCPILKQNGKYFWR